MYMEFRNCAWFLYHLVWIYILLENKFMSGYELQTQIKIGVLYNI